MRSVSRVDERYDRWQDKKACKIMIMKVTQYRADSGVVFCAIDF